MPSPWARALTTEPTGNGWHRVCLDCWQHANPTEYAPEATGFDDCERCDSPGMTVGVRSLTFLAIRAAWLD
jgi:hypothetical protein